MKKLLLLLVLCGCGGKHMPVNATEPINPTIPQTAPSAPLEVEEIPEASPSSIPSKCKNGKFAITESGDTLCITFIEKPKKPGNDYKFKCILEAEE